MSNPWSGDAARNYRQGRMSIAGRGSVYGQQPPQVIQVQPEIESLQELEIEEMDMEEFDDSPSNTNDTSGQGDDLNGNSQTDQGEEDSGADNFDPESSDDEAEPSLPPLPELDPDDQEGTSVPSTPSNATASSHAEKDRGAYAQSLRASVMGGAPLSEHLGLAPAPKPHQGIVPTYQPPHQPKAEEDIIDLLLEWNKLPWNFEGGQTKQRADYYRATGRFKLQGDEGSRQQFQHHHCPEYFSSQPLLPTQTTILIKISLPQNVVATFPSSVKKTKTVVKFSCTDFTDAVISSSLSDLHKHQLAEINPKDFVLKVVGQHSYLEWGQPLFSYHCVRKALRDNLDLELLLLRRPDPLVMSQRRQQEEMAYTKKYLDKIPPAAFNDIVQKHANAFNSHPLNVQEANKIKKVRQNYRDCFNSPLLPYHTNINPEIQQKYIDIKEIPTPISLTVAGLENLSLETLPRYNPSIVGVYVRCMLIHGYAEFPLEAPTTTVVNSSETVLFNEPILGSAQSLLCNMPRETRVAFIVYGKTATKDLEAPPPPPAKNQPENTTQLDLTAMNTQNVSTMAPDYTTDLPLAYVVTQMINERGELRSGPESFNLWPYPLSDGDDKHNKQVGSKRHLDPLFIFRTQNVDNQQCEVHQEEGSDQFFKRTMQFAKLRVRWPVFNTPVYSFDHKSLDVVFKEPSVRLVGSKTLPSLSKQVSQELLIILQRDYLWKLTPEQRALLWNCRHYLVDTPNILPKLLQCVDWGNPAMRNEMYRLLAQFTLPPDPVTVLILLDACYADSFVRAWAVNVLSQLSDDELKLYLLQLVQGLKYEPYHHSALSRFLINRAVSSPLTIGLTLFWYLKSEMIQPNVAERFTLILEEMLVYIGVYVNYILHKQSSMIYRLQYVAEHVWYLKRQMQLPTDEVYARFHALLHDFNATYFPGSTPAEQLEAPPPIPALPMGTSATAEPMEKEKVVDRHAKPEVNPSTHDDDDDRMSQKQDIAPSTTQLKDDDDIPYFIIPYLSSLRVKGLKVEKCKYMSSKMVPLWLVFQNVDEGCPPTYLIFKSGDDLRQDLLTLQLLTIFDRTWLAQGLDLCMNPYHVIPTGVNKAGEGVGMIEVVLNSRTVSDIQVTYGGGARGALRLDTIDLYLRETNTSGPQYVNAVQTFTRSVAGYCVATFILGIGDRHISNLMCQSTGRFFHIDFGHFLGNFKTKFGMKRERTAFVFNRDMAYVIAGSNKDFKKTRQFQNFRAIFTLAFKILRRNCSLFEQLFLLLIPGGLPELNVDSDLNYLREKMYIRYDAKSFEKSLQEELDKASGSLSRTMDGLIHNLAHSGK